MKDPTRLYYFARDLAVVQGYAYLVITSGTVVRESTYSVTLLIDRTYTYVGIRWVQESRFPETRVVRKRFIRNNSLHRPISYYTDLTMAEIAKVRQLLSLHAKELLPEDAPTEQWLAETLESYRDNNPEFFL